jgi:GT2 family glycosyltransferase
VNVTVLLLSVNEATMLARSLPAVLAQAPAADVVVIDNACTDDTARLAEQHGVRRIALHPRRSYAEAINLGIAGTGGEAVLLLNADCFLRAGFLPAALARLTEPGVGSVTPKLIRARRAPGDGPAGPAQLDAAGMVVDRRRKNGLVGHGRSAGAHARRAPAFGADGAAALYRRATLEACRLGKREVLDEDMALWASDVDLAWRAQLLGWRCEYEPAAVADHVRTYSPSTRAQVSERDRQIQFRNRYLMMIKNETVASLARDLVPIVIYELLALGHVLVRERHLLDAYAELPRHLRRALARRRLVQSRVCASAPFGLRAPA